MGLDVEVSRGWHRLDRLFQSPRMLEMESEGMTRRHGDWVQHLE